MLVLNKALYFVIGAMLLASIFSQMLYKASVVEAFLYIDEVFLIFSLLVMCITITISRREVRNFIQLCTFIIAFLLISYLGNSTGFTTSLLQAITHFKYFIFLALFSTVLSYSENRKLFTFLTTLVLLSCFVNIILQESHNQIFNTRAYYRFGVVRLEGLFLQANNLGIFLSAVLIYLYSSSHRYIFIKYKFAISLVLITLIVLTGSRAALIVSLSLIMFNYRRNARIFIVVVALIIGVILLPNDSAVVEQTIYHWNSLFNSDSTDYIRTIMLVNGYKLMIDNFPFGEGLATYGSVFSKDSETYSRLGIANMYNFEEYKGVFDSNWGSIMGELGIAGVIAFVYLLYINIIVSTGNRENKRWNYILAAMIVAYALVSPVFMNSYIAIPLALLSAIITKRGYEHGRIK